VGMCQTGAIGMAHQGQDHREILTHYYRGVVIRKLY
jgi:SpoIID/LytB domain protein